MGHSIFPNQPDIAKLHGVAMILEQHRAQRARIGLHPCPGVVNRDRDMVVNLDAVLRTLFAEGQVALES
jgi:hypothetical protein